MMPSALGIPETTPSAESRASSSPLSTRTLSPQRRPTSRTKSFPLAASRTAAVAMKAGRSTPIPRARRPNRAIAAERTFGRLIADLAGPGQLFAEPAGGALVEHRHRRPAIAVIDDEPHGVGADVDDRDRRVGRG